MFTRKPRLSKNLRSTVQKDFYNTICHKPTCVYYFPFARGLATSRAWSMKSFATGLSVRFLRVTMPTGTRVIGSVTGKTLSSGRAVGNLNAEAGTIVRKSPLARRLVRTSAER